MTLPQDPGRRRLRRGRPRADQGSHLRQRLALRAARAGRALRPAARRRAGASRPRPTRWSASSCRWRAPRRRSASPSPSRRPAPTPARCRRAPSATATSFVLNGTKRFISGSPFCDMAVIIALAPATTRRARDHRLLRRARPPGLPRRGRLQDDGRPVAHRQHRARRLPHPGRQPDRRTWPRPGAGARPHHRQPPAALPGDARPRAPRAARIPSPMRRSGASSASPSAPSRPSSTCWPTWPPNSPPRAR